MVTRRSFLALAAALPALGARAADVTELNWDDLIPGASPRRGAGLAGVVQHGQIDPGQSMPMGVVTRYNGSRVRLPGFVIPIEYSGAGVTSFILVPYVGACIHVPPPPPNQLVMVTTQIPYENNELFTPVEVTGLFETAQTRMELAEIGYRMEAERIAPYR